MIQTDRSDRPKSDTRNEMMLEGPVKMTSCVKTLKAPKKHASQVAALSLIRLNAYLFRNHLEVSLVNARLINVS